MSPLFLYNTLTRKKEEFKSIKPWEVGLYTCGPTVYNFAHIGNLRAFLFDDFLKRVLEYNSYHVKHVMNITDVGHLTDDADAGEDKIEKGAAREKKSAWEVAKFYTVAFKQDLALLNIKEPTIWCKATDYITEQIDLIKILEEKGYTYKISDGLYFNSSLVTDYNKLSHLPLEELREGARVEINLEKKNSTDFALWKFSPIGSKRQMEWRSPWGVGFPGWHIECTAMSLKCLGEQLDIHCGGVDHINIHHTNEIAQGEAATGRKFFNYWMHNAFLNIVGGKKMSKSEDNFLTLENAAVKKNINPLAYRYAALQASYRKPMEYSEDGLRQAEKGLYSLFNQIAALGKQAGTINVKFKAEFIKNVNDDLNFPRALAVLSAVLKSELSAADKLSTILDFDQVFGLKLEQASDFVRADIAISTLPLVVQKIIANRQAARTNKNWAQADQLRTEIERNGYFIEDTKDGIKITLAS